MGCWSVDGYIWALGVVYWCMGLEGEAGLDLAYGMRCELYAHEGWDWLLV